MVSTRKLLSFLKPHRRWAVLAPLMMALEVVMDVSLPHLTQRIVDLGIARHNTPVVVHSGLSMAVVALLALVGGTACTYYSVLAGQGFGADLRRAVFRKVQSLSFADLDTLRTGNLITRLTNDVTQLQDMVTMMLRVMVRMPLLLIGSMVMGSLTCPRLAPLFFVLVPAVVVILASIIRRTFPLFSGVQQALDRLNTIVHENLAGVRVVKAFVRAEHEHNRFSGIATDLSQRNTVASRVAALTMPLMMLSVNVGIVAALWIGGHEVIRAELKVGQLIAFISYLTQTLMSLMMASMLVARLARSEASASRILEVLDRTPILDEVDGSRNLRDVRLSGDIVFENVVFRYGSSDEDLVLDDISFRIRPGETVAILGATGAGKSSLVNLIPRFYDPESGVIKIDGVDLRSIPTRLLRRNVMPAFQDTILFSGTIRDNIRFGRPDAGDDAVKEAATQAQADEFIRNLPDGYDTVIGQRGVNLSGGQRQRLAIARALLTDPAILILDDSTSAVDVLTEARIQKSLAERRSGRTNVIVAQRVSAARRADKIIVLDDGRIVGEGEHSDLMRSCEIYREIYESQREMTVAADV